MRRETAHWQSACRARAWVQVPGNVTGMVTQVWNPSTGCAGPTDPQSSLARQSLQLGSPGSVRHPASKGEPQARWHKPFTPAPGRQKQVDLCSLRASPVYTEFQARQGYIARPCLHPLPHKTN